MPRKHSLFVRGTKDTAPLAATPRPYRWRRRGMTRDDALRAAGVGTARIPKPREEVPE